MIVWIVGVGISTATAGEPGLDRFDFTRVEMAVPVRIVLYAADGASASSAAGAAFSRIRQLNAILSDYDPESELRRLSSAALPSEGHGPSPSERAGKAVPVSEDLWRVLYESQAISRQSDGAFDVTVGPVVRLWRRARRTHLLPSPERLQAARELVGYQLIRLDAQHRAVELLKPGMQLDLGGIAKGYAIDEALGVLRQRGISRALVDAGGDIVVGDPPPGKPGWRIGIAPLDADLPAAGHENAPPSGQFGPVVLLSGAAIATSGDAWQYVEVGGRRYSHIVDPRTGLGLTDHSSVTVVAPQGIVADGLATAVSVLGPQQGLKLIENTPGAAALIIRAPQGKIETYQSSRWKDLRPALPE